MTDDPLAWLRDQLVAAADRRNEAAGPARARRSRRRGGWIALAVVLVVAPAGATAAGIIEFGESDEAKASAIVVDVLRDTSQLPACTRERTRRTVLSDGSPLRGISATLPSLRRTSASPARARPRCCCARSDRVGPGASRRASPSTRASTRSCSRGHRPGDPQRGDGERSRVAYPTGPALAGSRTPRSQT